MQPCIFLKICRLFQGFFFNLVSSYFEMWNTVSHFNLVGVAHKVCRLKIGDVLWEEPMQACRISRICWIYCLMANIWGKLHISILAGNLNSSLSCLITTQSNRNLTRLYETRKKNWMLSLILCYFHGYKLNYLVTQMLIKLRSHKKELGADYRLQT